MDKFSAGKVRARKYRNRRIGEFFKEIDLSEKQSTGISKILRELEQNGSPLPEFETDDDRTYLITTIKQRYGFVEQMAFVINVGDRSLTEVLVEVLPRQKFEKLIPLIAYLDEFREITPKKAEEILNKSTSTTQRYLRTLVETGEIIVKGNTNNITYEVKE